MLGLILFATPVRAGPTTTEADVQTPTPGNGRVYSQKETVVGSKLMRFTVSDAGLAVGPAGTGMGMRIIEVVRGEVATDGTESDRRVIHRDILPPAVDAPVVEPWLMDLLIDANRGVVYLGGASDTAFTLAAFKIDATPVGRDGRPQLDKPLPPEATPEQVQAATEAAMLKHRWHPKPKFDLAKAFVSHTRHVRLDLKDDEIIMTLRTDRVSDPDRKFVYQAK